MLIQALYCSSRRQALYRSICRLSATRTSLILKSIPTRHINTPTDSHRRTLQVKALRCNIIQHMVIQALFPTSSHSQTFTIHMVRQGLGNIPPQVRLWTPVLLS